MDIMTLSLAVLAFCTLAQFSFFLFDRWQRHQLVRRNMALLVAEPVKPRSDLGLALALGLGLVALGLYYVAKREL